ncbi:aldo/keto reductase [Actinoplanes sp. CA-030573]|uniref:aldo/keto reductase n=1 Tax=Actinoplanes sp. CA-030573 TaxID=3239898 RepID=UPI003D92235C
MTASPGLGCAPLGNLYSAISDGAAYDTVAAAWECGVRYFDTAPHYGLGLSERRLGAALRGLPRDAYEVSTKVGRLLVPAGSPAGRDPDLFEVPATHRRVWDFSADGVRRSLSESLSRLGLDRVDLVLLHDPEHHPRPALAEGYPALHRLRAEGVVRAIGVGSKDVGILSRFVAETDIDTVMVAGRYTLLEQPALPLLAECRRRSVAVVNVGVFNSGILAVEDPRQRPIYEYAAAPAPVLAKAAGIAETCRRHATTLPAAALAFAAAHPAVTKVVVGSQSRQQARANFGPRPEPPPELWADLVENGLLRPDAPIPVSAR